MRTHYILFQNIRHLKVIAKSFYNLIINKIWHKTYNKTDDNLSPQTQTCNPLLKWNYSNGEIIPYLKESFIFFDSNRAK